MVDIIQNYYRLPVFNPPQSENSVFKPDIYDHNRSPFTIEGKAYNYFHEQLRSVI